MGNHETERIPPHIIELMALGQHLYSIETIYRWGAEEKVDRRRNVTEEELSKLRRNIFLGGLVFMVEPGHWKVICPIDILSMDIHQQSGYFEEK